MAQRRQAPAAGPVDAAIRMYKNILGDCFLLKLRGEEGATNVLIDCGVLQGVTGGRETMVKVARDIVAECGGDPDGGVPGKLDLLVITHEHWDHISGFSYAQDLLLDKSKLEIGALWLAWTEKDGDEQAEALRSRFEKRKKAVAMVADPAAAAPQSAERGLSRFIGPLDQAGALGLGASLTGREILARLKGLAPASYLEPGNTVSTPGGVALRTYVLGPPRNEDRLFHDLPTPGSGESYIANRALNDQSIIAVAEDAGADLKDHSPFSKAHRGLTAADVRACRPSDAHPGSRAGAAAWLYDHYFADRTPCRFGNAPPPGHSCKRDPACDQDQARRRIDGDWLGAAGALALKLDSDTNNTSLVLAFELPGKDVLLFAADAQVGNWQSWHDQTYPVPGGRVDAEDILARTVLYKVGHHGSHNATLLDKGLTAMTSTRLTAMIPTVEEIAKRQGRKGWSMPFPKLKEDLLARTSGRVLRGDAAAGTDVGGARINDDPEFLGQCTEGGDGLWVEYRLRG